MPVKPMLGDIELQQVQKIEIEEDQVFTQHSIPALEGDFFQGLGRRSSWVKLSGVLTGAEVQDGLKDLRDRFRAAQPVDFVADIATATKVNKVIIEEMGVRELAGKPFRFEYAFTLREYIPAPQVVIEIPPVIIIPTDPLKARLIVRVIVEGEPDFDFSRVTVDIDGTREESGARFQQTLTRRVNNVWTEENFPPGNYTASARVPDDLSIPTGSTPAVVQRGHTTDVTIVLRRGRPMNVAKKFVVHFWFDRAFIEPCMRHVLKQVAEYARNHPNEKLLIVGNTDKSGSEVYNLSLGDRRARSVYAYLTFGRDPTARAEALAEWNFLRQPANGQSPTVKDSWDRRQSQYMLQTLGFYPSNVDGQNGPLTIAGVRDFQTSKGLPATGVVDDPTWAALIEDYLSQDPQSVAQSQFLENCPGEPLKWVSCGEQRPLRATPSARCCPSGGACSPASTCSDPESRCAPEATCAPEMAWRPNRRAELLFVVGDRLPEPELQPVTFNLPGTPPVGTGWCVGGRDPNPRALRCTFLVEGCTNPPANKWCVEPAEPGSITVTGSIVDENGNPLPNQEYVLIAPDGEFLSDQTDRCGRFKLGERVCSDRGSGKRGEPVPNKTRPNGTFDFTGRTTPIGIYIMEVKLPPVGHPPGPYIAHAATKPPATGRGSVVCKRLDASDSSFDVIILPGVPIRVNPRITLESAIAIVKKSYTNPARKRVLLDTDSAFLGTGTLTRSSNAIRFFTAAVDGTEITFDGTDNVFDGAQLTAGVELFAEGASPSAAMDDVQLTLTLASAEVLFGPPVTAPMTSVELTLDVCMSRTSDAVDPAPLPQPPSTPPPRSTADDKWFGGRFVHVQDPGNHQGRVLLIVRQVQPAAFSGDLVLRQVAITGNAITGLDAKLAVFDNEFQLAGEAAKLNPHEFNASTISPTGLQFWVEGQNVSGIIRDTGFQLGIKDLENDGDRTSLTVMRFSNLRAEIPSTPPNNPRLNNGPVPNSTLTHGTGAAPVASDFDIDFNTNLPLVLVHQSLTAGNRINFRVNVAPVGVPVSWSVQRDTRPAPNGDDPQIIALSPNSVPTLTPNPTNALQATLADDAVGSFHVRPFIDCNGNGQFDATQNTEPFMIMNLVLLRVGGTIGAGAAVTASTNSSVAQSFNIRITPAVPTSATGLGFQSGQFINPAVAAVNNNATIVVMGGGGDGRRGLDRLFAGWINNVIAQDIVAEYQDTATGDIHRHVTVFASNKPGGLGAQPAAFLPPGAALPPGSPIATSNAAPAIVPLPILDTTDFGNEGTGGNTAVGTEGVVGPPPPGVVRTNLAIGQTWQILMWDSPGHPCLASHLAFPGTLASFRYNLDFRCDLCFWTNVTGVPNPTPGPITGSPPPTPDAACCLYSTVQTNVWRIRFRINFNPTTGVGTIVTPGAVSITTDPNPIRLAQPLQGANHEARFPIVLRLFAFDAQT